MLQICSSCWVFNILEFTKADVELELDELEQAAELTLQEQEEAENLREHSKENLADIMDKKLVLNLGDSDDSSSDSEDSTDTDDSESDEENTE